MLMPMICFVCASSKTFGESGSSSTCFPSLCSSFWCCFDFSTRVRWMCFTTMSMATRFSTPRGIMMSICSGLSLSSRIPHGGRHTCNFALRLYITTKVWLDVRNPLLDASFYVSSPFSHITGNFLLLSISYQAIKATFPRKDVLRRARHRSASACAKIFMSSNSRTRGSYNAKIPSRIST